MSTELSALICRLQAQGEEEDQPGPLWELYRMHQAKGYGQRAGKNSLAPANFMSALMTFINLLPLGAVSVFASASAEARSKPAFFIASSNIHSIGPRRIRSPSGEFDPRCGEGAWPCVLAARHSC
uniref:Uncharacterized protein n=1 Tax=Knipowitschia caucasica TaxID=637954 RepID=A0AAV2KHL9_KNICA